MDDKELSRFGELSKHTGKQKWVNVVPEKAEGDFISPLSQSKKSNSSFPPPPKKSEPIISAGHVVPFSKKVKIFVNYAELNSDNKSEIPSVIKNMANYMIIVSFREGATNEVIEGKTLKTKVSVVEKTCKF